MSFISIARSGSFLHELSPKEALLREVTTPTLNEFVGQYLLFPLQYKEVDTLPTLNL